MRISLKFNIIIEVDYLFSKKNNNRNILEFGIILILLILIYLETHSNNVKGLIIGIFLIIFCLSNLVLLQDTNVQNINAMNSIQKLHISHN